MPLFAADGATAVQQQQFESGFISDWLINVFQELQVYCDILQSLQKTVSVYIIHTLILSLKNI